MVYPGGPSRGCYTCRARKVKCDEARPVCHRCTKGNHICGGYRVLEKEGTSKRLARNAQRKSPETSQVADPTRNQMTGSIDNSPVIQLHGNYGEGEYISTQLAGLCGSPKAVFDQNRMRQFYSHIVQLPQASTLYGGCLTCLPAILSELKGPSPLLPALSAVLLTFVSDKNRGGGLVPEAIDCYSRALMLTRRVVEERNERRRNEVILTVFILSMYEDLITADHARFASNSHLQGGMAIVKTQRNRNFEDPISRRLYSALLTRAMYTCFGKEADIPQNDFPFTIDELHSLHAALLLDPPTSPRASLQQVTCKLLIAHLELRELETSWPSFIEDPVSATHSILDAIAATDHQLSKWPRSLPQEWMYMTIHIPTGDGADLWSEFAHIYSTFWVGNDWAQYRTLRILTHSLRLRSFHLLTRFTASPSLDDLVDHITTTHDQIRSLASDICISMPYHLGYKDVSGKVRYPSEGFPTGKYARLISGCHILWPLYIAGIVEGVGLSQKLWISRQLDFIGSDMGFGKASVLAEMVRRSAVGDPLVSLSCRDLL